MKKRLLTILQYFFFAALAVFFVWLSLRKMDSAKWGQLKASLDRAHYWILIPTLLLLLLSHWVRALRWRQLMEPLGFHPSKINTFLAVIIGYFVNLGAPRVGEVVKCTILARYEKVPADKLVGTIVAERAFDMICLLLVFGLTFVFQFDVINALMKSSIYPLFQNSSGQTSYQKIFILLAIAVIGWLVLKYLISKLGHINIVQKINGILTGVWHGLTSVRNIRNKGLFFVYTITIWILYLLATYIGFYAIDETRNLNLADALTVLAMGSVGMIVSPGGIGAYALLVQEVVSFYGIQKEPYGMALGWLLWFGQFLSFVLFGVLSFILLPRINNKKYEEGRHHPGQNI